MVPQALAQVGVSVAWRKALSKSHAQWKGLGLNPALVSAREAESDEQQQEQQ